MTQTLRKRIIKTLITLITLGAGIWVSLQPTGLINAVNVHAQTSNCDVNKSTTTTTDDCDNVCVLLGNCPDKLKDTTSNPSNTVIGIISIVANGLIGLAVLISVFFIIYAGWMILSGGGEGKSDGIKEGQKMLINAFIGLAVSILSFIIVQYMVGFIDSLFRK
jgi:hypothetical protein